MLSGRHSGRERSAGSELGNGIEVVVEVLAPSAENGLLLVELAGA
jgi:hypothetical protein